MKKRIYHWRKRALSLLLALSMYISAACASGTLTGSTVVTGTKALVADVTAFLIWACPAVAACVVVYFFVRRGMADEQDGKLWQKRIVVAIVCGVAGCLGSTFINTIAAYY